ncbi:hypothetical protein [Schaalia odontolytica]|uniref:hypothetical protein n=1 Tax=Schaalia odontolytica TaxID=1660 RepID=UPI0028D06FFF|nr:hypothetical protein [Schaalia odontolytica]
MDDDITEEERQEAMEAAYGAVEDAVEATERALEEIEGARKAPPKGAKGELALAHKAATAALTHLRDARAVLAGA